MEKETVSVPCATLSIHSARGLDQICTGLVSPEDIGIDTDAETIDNYLHETEEYDNERGTEYRRNPPPLLSVGFV